MYGGYIPGTRDVSGLPMLVEYRVASGEVALDWTPSCAVDDTDFAVYGGKLGDFASHFARASSTSGATSITFQPAHENAYVLVAPVHEDPQMPTKGVTGRQSNGEDWPLGQQSRYPRDIRGCS